MIDLGLILTGIAIGIVVAAPIGPVNLICIRRALRTSVLSGFTAGAGAAFGDGVFAAIAAFGITAAIDFILANAIWLQIIGGTFLVGVGVHTYRSHPHLSENGSGAGAGVATAAGTTFFLTITNPATMFGFIAIFGGVAELATIDEDYGQAAILVVSVILGSLLWWACVSTFVGLFRRRMNDEILGWINKVSGVLIAGFGLTVMGRVVWKLMA